MPLNLTVMAKKAMFSALGIRVQDKGLTLQPSSPLKISLVALICETWKETVCVVGGGRWSGWGVLAVDEGLGREARGQKER